MHPDSYLAKVQRGELPEPPIARHLGCKLVSYDSANMVLKLRFAARPEFLNPVGQVHGGVLAAMMDETMAQTLAATLGPSELAATVEMKVSFISPARTTEFLGVGAVVSKKGSISFVEARLEDEAGTLLSKASATLKIVRWDGR